MQTAENEDECRQIRHALDVLSDHKKQALMIFIGQLVANQEAEDERKPHFHIV
jgi:hypothetical protein